MTTMLDKILDSKVEEVAAAKARISDADLSEQIAAQSRSRGFRAALDAKAATGYGRYEVVMTAAKGNGIISSFFTYTGPYFGDPHDEIDFEFNIPRD